MSQHEILQQIETWKPLIRKLARKFRNTICAPEDLEHEGILGLIKALRNYDKKRGANINSFIYQCVWSQIVCTALENVGPNYCPAGTLLYNKNLMYKQMQLVKDTVHLDREKTDIPISSTYNMIDTMDMWNRFDPAKIAKLYYIDDYSQKRIARKMGMSIRNVRAYLKYFKIWMRKNCFR